MEKTNRPESSQSAPAFDGRGVLNRHFFATFGDEQ